MLRIYDGQESEYYFRKFKKVKTRTSPVIETDDYETYKLAFSETVYSDPSTQFVFNDDIDISELRDNLGRPLSELYLTIIKTDSDTLFGKISSGIATPFIEKLTSSGTNPYLRDIPVISRIHNGTTPFISHTPLEQQILINTDYFYGDLVEFNKREVKETVLAEVSHRFNTLNRESAVSISAVTSLGEVPTKELISLGPRQEGYVYKPHTLIKIRDFSSYIEQGDINIDEIPDYAINLGDSRYLWRDILDIGFSDGIVKAINYPFLNGCHYMYQNNIFFVKRQDPFSQWGLFYGRFPADPTGEQITNNFKVNTEGSVY
jgi:hypothetical protein